jgi:acetyl esterase/lipase
VSAPATTGRVLLSLLHRPKHFAYGDHACQKADLHLPEGDGRVPVVVVVHGGSWHARYGKGVMHFVCADLARRGFAAWNLEYRRLGGKGGGWPMTYDDVGAGIDHLAVLDHARLDLERVVYLGHSAGGQLALWAASRDAPRVPPVRAVALAAPLNLAVAGANACELMGGTAEEQPERYAAADPMRFLPVGVPTLLVHGLDDGTVPVARSRDYAAAARAAGDEVELIEIPGADHRAPVDPRSEAWRAAAERL